MLDFADHFLRSLGEVDSFPLKSASPSCGVRDVKIYCKGRRVTGRGDGLFAKVVWESVTSIPVESEKRLLNQDIGRNFYTLIFTIAYVRESLDQSATREDIIDLHRSLKYLLLLYSYAYQKKLGRLLAERGWHDLEELEREYRSQMIHALSHPVKQS